MRELVIYGTGGMAKEVYQLLNDVNSNTLTWDCLGFLDDSCNNRDGCFLELPVLGTGDFLIRNPDVWVVLAIGNTAVRYRIARRLIERGHRNFATLIHPRAWIGSHIRIGQGVTIFAGSAVSTYIHIGDFGLINKNATIGHDVCIGDFVTVSPAASISGNVTIGEGCDLGANSTYIQGVSIGEWSIVGAGAVVTKTLGSNVTAVGVPAKVIKTREPGWHLV